MTDGVDRTNRERFDRLVVPHLDAAFNLARWLTGNDAAAKDVVQESCLRAFRFMHRFGGGNARAWLLTIVRNESYTSLKKAASGDLPLPLSEGREEIFGEFPRQYTETPEKILIRLQDARLVQIALATLPAPWREVIVLRELEEMSYQDIAEVIKAPMGTVMSRLARGREALKDILGKMVDDEGPGTI